MAFFDAIFSALQAIVVLATVGWISAMVLLLVIVGISFLVFPCETWAAKWCARQKGGARV